MPLSSPDMQPPPRTIAIVGPTASGKSVLGLRLAERFNGEIISADSRTIYRFLDIGTAKPSRDPVVSELPCGCAFRSGGIVHHLIDRLDPSETASVVRFKTLATACIADMMKRGKVPCIVGGTGQYADSLIRPVALPPIAPDPSIRARIEMLSLPEQVSLLRARDPHTAQHIDIKNPRRVARALEIVLSTGIPRSEAVPAEPLIRTLSLGLAPTIERIRERIERRIDEQLAAGLEREAVSLAERYGWDAPGLKAIGYHEWRPWHEGSSTLSEVRARLIFDTRHYAKRQMTWFKRDFSICWLDASGDVFLQASMLAKNFLSADPSDLPSR